MSGTEIVVILLLALVVLGPEKLPEAIRKFGKTYAELKKMGTGFQQEFKSAIDEPMREMRETADLLKKSADFTTPDVTPAQPRRRRPTPSLTARRATTASRPPIPTSCRPTTCRSPTTDGAAADVAADDDGAAADVAADEDGACRCRRRRRRRRTSDAVPAGVVDDPPDESADRGEADDA